MITVIDRQHNPQRLAGSFRDPSGYVFAQGSRVYRAVDANCYRTLRQVAEQGLLADLIDQQKVVATRFIDKPSEHADLAAAHPGFDCFLEHAVVRPITYPYEWTYSMLADAALLTLDLQIQLVQRGYALKDASAYNIQFRLGRPVFIDLASIEKCQPTGVWYALGQFQRMFTYPLLLARYHGWDLKSYFLGRLDGRDAEEAWSSLSWWQRWHPRSLLDLTLPLLLGRRAQGAGSQRTAPCSGGNVQAQLWNLRRLQRKIARLAAGYRPPGAWKEYEETSGHSEAYRRAKQSAIQGFLRSTWPSRVLDIGCNTGEYSLLAAQAGAHVLAADADHGAVEVLYRKLRGLGLAITPLVLDLANPSPGVGYQNRERPGILERLDVDCVFALALMHHLVVNGNLSLAALAELLACLTTRHLVLEFVPPEDRLFQRLLHFRKDAYNHVSLPACRAALQPYFEVAGDCPLADSGRTLLFLRKRA